MDVNFHKIDENYWEVEDNDVELEFIQSLESQNIQTFNLKRFSNLNFKENIDTITNHIQKTVSNQVEGVKVKHKGHEFVITHKHTLEEYGGKKIGEGGFGTITATSNYCVCCKENKIKATFAIKKLDPTIAAVKEMAYNEFKINKQMSKNDEILRVDHRGGYIGCILREDAYFIIMDRIYFTLADIIERCRKLNLAWFFDEDVLKYIFIDTIDQLALLSDAGASHGDIKPSNIMVVYNIGLYRIDLDSARTELIDLGS